MSQCLEFPGIELLAVYATGGTGDGFVHQSPTEVVGPGIQAQRGTARAHFYPRNLNVPDQGIQHQAGYRVHEHGLAECGARTGLSLTPQRSLHMNIAQRHELGNTAGACL